MLTSPPLPTTTTPPTQGMMYGVSPSMSPYDPYGQQHLVYAAPAPVNDWGRSSDPFPMPGTVSPPRRPPSSREHPQMARASEMMYRSLPAHHMPYPQPMMPVRPSKWKGKGGLGRGASTPG